MRGPMDAPVANPQSSTVHVVEDDSAVREALCLLLTAEGFRARGWRDGESFLRGAEPASDDVLLLDLSLPGMDGVAVADALKERGCEAAIALLSGARGAAFAGAVDRIQPQLALRKPVDATSIAAAVKSLFGRRATTALS